MKKKLLALFMGILLLLSACGGGNDNAGNGSGNKDQGTTTAGAGNAAKLFENHCSSCHGQNLEGQVGPKLSDAGSHLSKGDIEKIIAEGKGNMPSGLLKGDEASQVATWLSKKK